MERAPQLPPPEDEQRGDCLRCEFEPDGRTTSIGEALSSATLMSSPQVKDGVLEAEALAAWRAEVADYQRALQLIKDYVRQAVGPVSFRTLSAAIQSEGLTAHLADEAIGASYGHSLEEQPNGLLVAASPKA